MLSKVSSISIRNSQQTTDMNCRVSVLDIPYVNSHLLRRRPSDRRGPLSSSVSVPKASKRGRTERTPLHLPVRVNRRLRQEAKKRIVKSKYQNADCLSKNKGKVGF